MRSTILAAAALFTAVFAAPEASFGKKLAKRDAACMSDAEASEVGNAFGGLIGHYDKSVADYYLTVDYTDYSDSVNELVNGGCDGPVPVSVIAVEGAKGKDS